MSQTLHNLELIEGFLSKPQYRRPIIAIDGPAGAGKSTVARLLAKQLRFLLIDTGALYRSVAYEAIQSDIQMNSGKDLARLALDLNLKFGEVFLHDNGTLKQKIFVDQKDYTDCIRTPQVAMVASKISGNAELRSALLDKQRLFGEKGGIVMEGRDIGTVIFPAAEIKFYLEASVESRAHRRLKEHQIAGRPYELQQVLEEIKRRDHQDMSREVAPLKKADDAILVDSTDKTLDEVVGNMSNVILEYYRTQKMGSINEVNPS